MDEGAVTFCCRYGRYTNNINLTVCRFSSKPSYFNVSSWPSNVNLKGPQSFMHIFVVLNFMSQTNTLRYVHFA